MQGIKRNTNFQELSCIVCNAPMNWDSTDKEWVCLKCGNRAFQTDDCSLDEVYYEHTPEEMTD